MQYTIPIRKIDEERRLVFGRAVEETPDRSDEIMDYESSKPLIEAWSRETSDMTGGKSLGNIRVMHGKQAAGVIKEIDFKDGEKAVDIVVKVVDDNEWKKCLEGVYTGFSIGGSYAKKWTDGKYTRYTAQPTEISLVDRPCIPSAMFYELVKADGISKQKVFKSVDMSDPLRVMRELAKARDADGDGRIYDGTPYETAADSLAPEGAIAGGVAGAVAGGKVGAMLGRRNPEGRKAAVGARNQARMDGEAARATHAQPKTVARAQEKSSKAGTKTYQASRAVGNDHEGSNRMAHRVAASTHRAEIDKDIRTTNKARASQAAVGARKTTLRSAAEAAVAPGMKRLASRGKIAGGIAGAIGGAILAHQLGKADGRAGRDGDGDGQVNEGSAAGAGATAAAVGLTAARAAHRPADRALGAAERKFGPGIERAASQRAAVDTMKFGAQSTKLKAKAAEAQVRSQAGTSKPLAAAPKADPMALNLGRKRGTGKPNLGTGNAPAHVVDAAARQAKVGVYRQARQSAQNVGTLAASNAASNLRLGRNLGAAGAALGTGAAAAYGTYQGFNALFGKMAKADGRAGRDGDGDGQLNEKGNAPSGSPIRRDLMATIKRGKQGDDRYVDDLHVVSEGIHAAALTEANKETDRLKWERTYEKHAFDLVNEIADPDARVDAASVLYARMEDDAPKMSSADRRRYQQQLQESGNSRSLGGAIVGGIGGNIVGSAVGGAAGYAAGALIGRGLRSPTFGNALGNSLAGATSLGGAIYGTYAGARAGWHGFRAEKMAGPNTAALLKAATGRDGDGDGLVNERERKGKQSGVEQVARGAGALAGGALAGRAGDAMASLMRRGGKGRFAVPAMAAAAVGSTVLGERAGGYIGRRADEAMSPRARQQADEATGYAQAMTYGAKAGAVAGGVGGFLASKRNLKPMRAGLLGGAAAGAVGGAAWQFLGKGDMGPNTASLFKADDRRGKGATRKDGKPDGRAGRDNDGDGKFNERGDQSKGKGEKKAPNAYKQAKAVVLDKLKGLGGAAKTFASQVTVDLDATDDGVRVSIKHTDPESGRVRNLGSQTMTEDQIKAKGGDLAVAAYHVFRVYKTGTAKSPQNKVDEKKQGEWDKYYKDTNAQRTRDESKAEGYVTGRQTERVKAWEAEQRKKEGKPEVKNPGRPLNYGASINKPAEAGAKTESRFGTVESSNRFNRETGNQLARPIGSGSYSGGSVFADPNKRTEEVKREYAQTHNAPGQTAATPKPAPQGQANETLKQARAFINEGKRGGNGQPPPYKADPELKAKDILTVFKDSEFQALPQRDRWETAMMTEFSSVNDIPKDADGLKTMFQSRINDHARKGLYTISTGHDGKPQASPMLEADRALILYAPWPGGAQQKSMMTDLLNNHQRRFLNEWKQAGQLGNPEADRADAQYKQMLNRSVPTGSLAKSNSQAIATWLAKSAPRQSRRRMAKSDGRAGRDADGDGRVNERENRGKESAAENAVRRAPVPRQVSERFDQDEADLSQNWNVERVGGGLSANFAQVGAEHLFNHFVPGGKAISAGAKALRFGGETIAGTAGGIAGGVAGGLAGEATDRAAGNADYEPNWNEGKGEFIGRVAGGFLGQWGGRAAAGALAAPTGPGAIAASIAGGGIGSYAGEEAGAWLGRQADQYLFSNHFKT